MLDQIDDIDTEISMIEEKLLSLVREQREIQDYETSKALEVDDEENMDLTLQKENSDLDDNDNDLDESNSMDVEENITVRDVLLPVVHGKWKNYDFHRLASRIKYENQSILESSKCPSSTAIEVLNFSVDPIYFSVQADEGF